jgi:hypothetical protein
MSIQASSQPGESIETSKSIAALWTFGKVAAIGLVLFLALYHLTGYPVTWFDEGSHLHVPKSIELFGVYADYSSEGFRYYGPTVGIGPTIMLPIAGVFRILGMGLLQARLVIVLYLLGTIYVFYRFTDKFQGVRLAWVATALLVVTRGVGLLEYGRQVLGEAPGFFFLMVGLWLWFSAWERAGWLRLILVGLFLGLSTVTKNQYLLILAPTLGFAWFTNLVYYRKLPQRFFIVPGLLTVACYAIWQSILVLSLGPATASENLQSLRVATTGAALVFSPELMKRGIQELLSLKVYLGWLAPVLVYGFLLALPRRKEGQQWGLLFTLVGMNLVWYVVASISWIRYAFPGLAISSLFVARFFHDITDGFKWDLKEFWQNIRQGEKIVTVSAIRGVFLVWLAAMLVLPLGQSLRDIVVPPFNAPKVMAAYMDANVPTSALVETWEPEMGFLTDHKYHYPPQLLLDTAVGYIWRHGPAPSQSYHFMEPTAPEYVLVGEFSRWVNLYPTGQLSAHYSLVTSIGGYELYKYTGQ